MARKAKTPEIPPAWQIARKAVRTDIMHTRIHGQQPNKTLRRKAKQRGWSADD